MLREIEVLRAERFHLNARLNRLEWVHAGNPFYRDEIEASIEELEDEFDELTDKLCELHDPNVFVV